LQQKIRTFIAIEIPASILEKISSFQNMLKMYNADVRWVRPESIHLTLKFLGDVEQKSIDRLNSAIQDASKRIDPFMVSICGAGTFPNDRRPRIIWVGVKEGIQKLELLVSNLEDCLSKLGFNKEEKRFRPHLTLGRVRSIHNINSTIEAMYSSEFKGGMFEASEIVLMKSDLKPTGAVYNILKKTKLQG
jgi:2'-5' RNA ligase